MVLLMCETVYDLHLRSFLGPLGFRGFGCVYNKLESSPRKLSYLYTMSIDRSTAFCTSKINFENIKKRAFHILSKILSNKCLYLGITHILLKGGRFNKILKIFEVVRRQNKSRNSVCEVAVQCASG